MGFIHLPSTKLTSSQPSVPYTSSSSRHRTLSFCHVSSFPKQTTIKSQTLAYKYATLKSDLFSDLSTIPALSTPTILYIFNNYFQRVCFNCGDRAMEKRFEVGYALTPKKQESFIQESLVTMLKEKGIDLVKIDMDKPLVDQGNFDCVIHKMYGDEWSKQLDEFKVRNPDALIVDHPDDIRRLHNRITMLKFVEDIEVESSCAEMNETETFGIPKQIVVYEEERLLDKGMWVESLKFPVIAKPLVADGSAKSHKMSLVFDVVALGKLKPPIVLQEFVNHGGVIFKVYVVGKRVVCVKRKSLQDYSDEKLGTLQGSMSFSQISNLTAQVKDRDKYYESMNLDEVEMPPQDFIAKIAKGLRKATNLNLFNFDVIRDVRVENRYLVVDINYFPGYAKMPSYESVLTEFFCDMAQERKECKHRS